MKNIYIDSSEGYFLEKIFKKDMVSIDEILNKFEDLICDNDRLQEELEDLKQDLYDNFKPIPPEDQYE